MTTPSASRAESAWREVKRVEGLSIAPAKALKLAERAAQTEYFRPLPPARPSETAEQTESFRHVRTALIVKAGLGDLLEESTQPVQMQPNRMFTFPHARVIVLFTHNNVRSTKP
jgi:hypothetical protein